MARVKATSAATQALADEQALGIQREPVPDGAVITAPSGPLLKYSPEDLNKLDQFAIGLLRDGTGAMAASDVAFTNRVVHAYERAQVMLEISKQVAAQEA